jgi:predicted RNA binding protein YcfA (HicA-like mRNA interferase family)
MRLKTRTIIDIISDDGWVLCTQEGSHAQYKHPSKKGKVTVPIHGMNEMLDHPLVGSIFAQAAIDLKDVRKKLNR